MSASESGRKAILAALAANLGIAVSKFAAFFFTTSSSMLSEGIHSLADCGNQVLLLVGSKRAQQPADEHHNFGYGRRRYVYGFLVAIILFTLGGLFSLYEGWHKWTHPEPLEHAWVALLVLLVAIALEGVSLRTAKAEADHVRGTRSIVRYVRDARSPEIVVILLEDAGAILGLSLALLGVSAAAVTGNSRFDAAGALLVGVLLVAIALVLARETAAMLVGESALPEEAAAIRAALEAADGVERVIHLRTLYLGPDQLLVGVKIAVSHADSAREVAADIDAAEAAIRSAVPKAAYVFIEPDIDRGEQAPPAPPVP